MTSPGSKKAASGDAKPSRPNVVRRAKQSATKQPATKQPATKQPTASPKAATTTKRPQRRRPAAEVPGLGAAGYLDRVPVDGAGRMLLPLAGLLAAAGAVLVVVADFLPYLALDGEQVTASQNAWSVIAHALLLLVGLGGGALLMSGRGGRVGPALIAAASCLGPGYLLLNVFAGADPRSHQLTEYYFGELYTTIDIQSRTGRVLAIAGWALLLLAGLLAAAAWRSVAERDLLPLGAGRRFAAGSAGLAGLLAIVAMILPPALTEIVKYTDPSGLVLTRELPAPYSAVGGSGLALAGGLLLIGGWLAAAAVVGSMSTRITVVAGLAGLAAVLLHAALLNARDVSVGANLAPGPRLYLLLTAGLIAAGAAGYAARVRGRDPVRLVSDQSDPFSAEELP